MTARRFSDEDEIRLAKDVAELGGAAAARKWGITFQGAYKIAARRGWKSTTHSEWLTKHTLRKDAFCEPLSPEARYWIGFIYADGAITPGTDGRQPMLTLDLATEDSEAVKRLQTFLGSSHKVQTRKASVRLQIRSRDLVADLARFNIAPRKQGHEVPPAALANDRHFWRGVIDGDGTCTDYNYGIVSLCGSIDTIKAWISFCESLGAKTGKAPSSRSSIFGCAHYSKHDRLLVARELYRPGEWSLARKRRIAEAWVAAADQP